MKSLRMSQKYRILDYQWIACRYLYMLWLDLGDKIRSMDFMRKTLQLARQIKRRQMIALSQFDSARLKSLQNSQRNITRLVTKGLVISKRYNIADAIAEGLLIASESEIERKIYTEATKHARRALDFAVQKGRKPDQANAHLLLADILSDEEPCDRFELIGKRLHDQVRQLRGRPDWKRQNMADFLEGVWSLAPDHLFRTLIHLADRHLHLLVLPVVRDTGDLLGFNLFLENLTLLLEQRFGHGRHVLGGALLAGLDHDVRGCEYRRIRQARRIARPAASERRIGHDERTDRQ